MILHIGSADTLNQRLLLNVMVLHVKIILKK